MIKIISSIPSSFGDLPLGDYPFNIISLLMGTYFVPYSTCMTLLLTFIGVDNTNIIEVYIFVTIDLLTGVASKIKLSH